LLLLLLWAAWCNGTKAAGVRVCMRALMLLPWGLIKPTAASSSIASSSLPAADQSCLQHC
jgi:hypothetical protein